MSRPIKHYGKWRIRWVDEHGQRQSAVVDDHKNALLLLRHQPRAFIVRLETEGLDPRADRLAPAVARMDLARSFAEGSHVVDGLS